jgi:endo-1,4-beta-xylanase
MRKLYYSIICFIIGFFFLAVGTIKPASSVLSWDFESNNIGDSLAHISWSPYDIQSAVVDDPLASGNKVMENVVHGYNAAPVLMFVLPQGKTLADYDSLTFKGYFQKGDVAYKYIVAEAYQTKPAGHHFLDTDTLASYNRAQGASTAWENISLDISNTTAFSDTVYIVFGINCAGTANGDTTTWFADDIKLVAKVNNPPPPPPANLPVVTNGGFEDSNVGSVDSMNVKGWLFLVAQGISPLPEIEIVDDTVEQGNRALKVAIHGIGTNQWDIQAVADSIHVTPGVTYNYSIWAKASKAGAQVNFTIGSYTLGEYGAIRPANLTTSWKKYSMTFKVTNNETVIRGPIHFSYLADTGKVIYIDNLQIVDVNAPKRPVIVEAESGALGSNFTVKQENNITYVTAVNNNTLFVPGDSSRVATYHVTFSDSGHYNLFARVRVGPNNYNDDSFFYGHGFGDKNDTAGGDWVFINGLASAGFSDTSAFVTGVGTGGSQIWKWVNLTQDTIQFPGYSFYVSPDSLTKTFQIGTREDGLDIDKLAFGKNNLFFTVNALDYGLTGATSTVIDSSKFYKGPPLAQGSTEFLGNVKDAYGDNNFANYWNQITPGNEGKWGSVAGAQDTASWNWSGLDTLYNYAQSHHLIFKDHNLIWGAQQPSWISGLDSATQYKYIETWIRMVGQRYPKIDMIDVVNEPLNGHNPPDGGNGRANYKNALGGNGATGWDWVIKSFELARKYLPNAKLLINDYGIINDNSATTSYVQIINLLKDRGLIDGIGVQGHRFALESADTATLRNNLNKLGATGLPVYISELDLGNIGNTGTPNDNTQLQLYQKIFPILWKNPAMKGITLWGYKEGEMWQTTCYLVRSDGTWRPALTWLAQYVKKNPLGVNETASVLPSKYELDQNFPNPFNPSTNIRYSIVKTSKVTLKIYDILGRLVQTLINTVQAPGQYTVSFNAQNLASGVYFYQINAGNFIATKKLMLVK